MNTDFFGAKTHGTLFRLVATALLSTMWLTMTGCASFDLSKPIPWGTNDDAIDKPPGRLSAVWTDTIMTQPDKPAMRGFGGRIMFFDQNDEPIKTEGTMEVYAWDETDRDPANPAPDRKFVFHTKDFEKHYSKGRLGHSYSFWIPWDEVGGKQTQISLMVKFSPTHGGKIIGEQSKHVLPGSISTPAASPLRDQLREQITAQQILNQQRMPQQIPQQMNGQQFPMQQNGNQQSGMMMPMQNQNQNFQQFNGQAAMQMPSNGQPMTYDNQVMTASYDQNSAQQNAMYSVMQNSANSVNTAGGMISQNPSINDSTTNAGWQSNAVGPRGSMESYEIPLRAGSPLARTNSSKPQTLPQANQSMPMLNNQIPTQFAPSMMQQPGYNGQMMNGGTFSPDNQTSSFHDRALGTSMGMRQKAMTARHDRITNGLKNSRATNNQNGVIVQSNAIQSNNVMAQNMSMQNNAAMMPNMMGQNNMSAMQSNLPIQNSQVAANQDLGQNGNVGSGYNTTVSYGQIAR